MPYFVISVIFSLLLYILAIVSLFGIAILLILFVFLLYANVVMLGSIRGNGIRISEKQFPDVYARVVSLSEKMNIKKVLIIYIVTIFIFSSLNKISHLIFINIFFSIFPSA